MKSAFIILASIAGLSLTAGDLSYEGNPGGCVPPGLRGGPEKTGSSDALEIAQILLNSQLFSCLETIRESFYNIHWSKLTSQAQRGGNTEYTLKGTAVRGGDMAVGPAYINITKSTGQDPFGNPREHYTCSTALPE